jgi:hypothetical protein
MPPIVTWGPGIHIGDHFLAATLERDHYDPNPHIIEGHRLTQFKQHGKLVVAGEGLNACACDRIEIDWLPFCAEKYHISANIDDYVIVPVPIVVENFPNRNLDGFPYDELTAWRTMIGRPAYKTFIGKPVHQDHDNKDDEKAKGVIIDATLVPFYGRWHVKILKAFDRSKDERLAKLVQKRNRIGHSMGALVEQTECSLPWCRFLSDGVTTCQHINGGEGKGQIVRGHLVYEVLRSFNFIESSSVEDPAYVVALSEEILAA